MFDGEKEIFKEEGAGNQTVHSAADKRFAHTLAMGVITAENKLRCLCRLPQQTHRICKLIGAEIAGEQNHIRRSIAQESNSRIKVGDNTQINGRFAQSGLNIRREHLLVGYKKNAAYSGNRHSVFINRQSQRNIKTTAFAKLTLHGDSAAHQVNKAFRDAHAETGALNFIDCGILLAGKRLENMLLKLFRHAEAVIDNRGTNCGIVRIFAGQLADFKGNRAAGGRIFDGVCQQIQENLTNTNAVPYQIFMSYLVDTDCEALPLLAALRTYNTLNLPGLLRHFDRFHSELNLAGLDFAHIENVIYKAEHMPPGCLKFFDVIALFLRIVRLMLHQARHADYGVHGSADIMRHVGEELTFCLCGGLSRGKGP